MIPSLAITPPIAESVAGMTLSVPSPVTSRHRSPQRQVDPIQAAADQNTQRAAAGNQAMLVVINKGVSASTTVLSIPTPLLMIDRPPAAGTLTAPLAVVEAVGRSSATSLR